MLKLNGETRVKYLLFSSLLLTSVQAFAWQTVVTCDDGALVVDVGSSSDVYQIVIRDAKTVQYFSKSMQLNPNDRGELIYPSVRHNDWSQGFSTSYPGIGGVSLTPEGSGAYLYASRAGGRDANWHFKSCQGF
jgi:hypothetical protein